MCVCVCVCVCALRALTDRQTAVGVGGVWEKERATTRAVTKAVRGREKKRAAESLCRKTDRKLKEQR